jgi:uncharacterized protein (TIGR03435 family)
MARHSLHRQTSCVVLIACVVASVAAADSIRAQTASPASTTADASNDGTAKAPTYEIVSIKPSKAGSGAGGWWKTLPDGFQFRNMSLRSVIYSAYGIIMEGQVSGMPGWAEADPYDIDAKIDADTAAAWKNLPNEERWKQEQPMLQALLADRCQLKAHLEIKELPVFDLVIARGGLKMKEAPSSQQASYTVNWGNSDSTFTARATSVQSLAMSLSSSVGRIIVDKTGLGEKKFDFELKWTPDEQRAADAASAGPSLFTALEEQLGLKLVPSKGPVDVLVIDRIEKPSAN